MSRKTFINLIVSLLCLFPILTQAQSLTQYEYWFDDNISTRKTGSLSGTSAVVKASIDTEQVGFGLHKFCFRAKQSDGMYSAVTSSLFMKGVAPQGSIIEYWFDDMIDQMASTSISDTEDEQSINLDLRDNTKFPFGLHKLNIRLVIGGNPSVVYSTPVLKIMAGNPSHLQYWVDDDFANARTIDGTQTFDQYWSVRRHHPRPSSPLLPPRQQQQDNRRRRHLHAHHREVEVSCGES